MKKFLSLFFAAVLSLSIVAIASASYNPFDDHFKYEARQLRERGIAKNVFTVFDTNKKQIKTNITVIYRDHSGITKEASADADGKIFVNFTEPGYIQALKVRISGTEYDIVGKDNYEDFDYEDIYKGDVEIKAIQLNTNGKTAYIYDAD